MMATNYFSFLFSAFLFSCSPLATKETAVVRNTAKKKKEEAVLKAEIKKKIETKKIEKEDPCMAESAQEAFLLLSLKKPSMSELLNTEVYYESGEEKMLVVSQLKRKQYMQNTGTFIEVSVFLGTRGSRVESFSQVISTKESFVPILSIYSDLPPFWSEKITNEVPFLTLEHYLLEGEKKGFVKYENDIVVELGHRLPDSTMLLCRASVKCKCL